ncbi:MAG TPA: hypothetical protein VNQ79_20140 [Blastocatellia bacterium]|nr:hypothetical protein [Blastocatellia bacterium]
MLEKNETDLPKFFAWARPRVYREYEARLKADPQLDPNWTFSDIMQELLAEYRRTQATETTAEIKTEQD